MEDRTVIQSNEKLFRSATDNITLQKQKKGHFVICFLAFLLQRTLEYILRRKGKGISSERIMEAIYSMNFFEIEIKGKKYLIKQKIEGEAGDILNVMKIKGPKNFMTYEEGLEFIGISNDVVTKLRSIFCQSQSSQAFELQTDKSRKLFVFKSLKFTLFKKT